METLVYIARHGEVDPRWRDRVYGCLDVELSRAGEDEARACAAFLDGVDLDAVFTSPLARARFSADLLAERRGLVPRAHAGLVELDRGEWAGLSFGELEARAPGALAAWNRAPDVVRPPRGESLADLVVRVKTALAECIVPGRHRTVAVAAHGWVARVLLCQALGLELASAARLRMRTACLSAVRWHAGEAVELLGVDLDGPIH
jgi:probable phosphoglycerate mutase